MIIASGSFPASHSALFFWRYFSLLPVREMINIIKKFSKLSNGNGIVIKIMDDSSFEPTFSPRDLCNPYKESIDIGLKNGCKYEDGDIKCVCNDNESDISYHGTSINNIFRILKEGYKLSKCKRESYGKGIYSTPDINIALSYAPKYTPENGFEFKFVIKNHVKKSKCEIIPKEKNNEGADSWIALDENNIHPIFVMVFSLLK